MKVWLTIPLLLLIAGCGGGDDTPQNTSESIAQTKSVKISGDDSVSPEEADAALTLCQTGQVNELRVMLTDKPSIANATVYRDDNLLNVVIDTRPEFPNMHDTIKVLLEAGGDPNRNAPELLRKVIWRGDPDGLKLLLEFGADPTIVSAKKKMNMLDYARSAGDKRLIAVIEDWENTQR